MKKNFKYDSSYESKNKQRIQELVEYILDKEYGETIPLEKLGEMLHYNINDVDELKKFKSTMERVKNFLVDYGYILKSISGRGYYILKPKQIAGHCYRSYISKTQRILNKCERILDHTDKTELSEERKQEHSEVLQLNKDMSDKFHNTIQTSKYYNRKAYYDSLKD